MKMRLAFLRMIVLLLGTAFTGCQPKVVGKTVLNILAYGDNSNIEGQDWVRIVTAFETENPDIDIQYEMLYDEAYHQEVAARLASGDIPDLAYMGDDQRWGRLWEEAEQQFDHRPFIDPYYYDITLIPPMGINGEIWEIPLGATNIASVLFMNAALVQSLGFSTPKTYEDIVAMVPAAKAKGLDVVSIDGADGWAWGVCLLSCIIARLSGDTKWFSSVVAGNNRFTDKAFIDSLVLIRRMVNDGVISKKSILVDYESNIDNFSNNKALFMVQGQWAAGGVEQAVADQTVMIAWPKLPGERANMANSVAAAIQTGYGLTKAGAANPVVREAALKFLKYFNSEPESIKRLLDGTIVAPILKNYQVPADLSAIAKQKIKLAQTIIKTEIIDQYLYGDTNDALNTSRSIPN